MRGVGVGEGGKKINRLLFPHGNVNTLCGGHDICNIWRLACLGKREKKDIKGKSSKKLGTGK